MLWYVGPVAKFQEVNKNNINVEIDMPSFDIYIVICTISGLMSAMFLEYKKGSESYNTSTGYLYWFRLWADILKNHIGVMGIVMVLGYAGTPPQCRYVYISL